MSGRITGYVVLFDDFSCHPRGGASVQARPQRALEHGGNGDLCKADRSNSGAPRGEGNSFPGHVQPDNSSASGQHSKA